MDLRSQAKPESNTGESPPTVLLLQIGVLTQTPCYTYNRFSINISKPRAIPTRIASIGNPGITTTAVAVPSVLVIVIGCTLPEVSALVAVTVTVVVTEMIVSSMM